VRGAKYHPAPDRNRSDSNQRRRSGWISSGAAIGSAIGATPMGPTSTLVRRLITLIRVVAG